MRYRPLGRTGQYVSEICLGAMTFHGGSAGGMWRNIGTLDQSASTKLVGRALEAGVNFIDTANVYSEGQSEVQVGQALRDLGVKREDVIIATKVRSRMGQGPNSVGLSRGHIMDQIAASLKRLGLDHVDLYQIHGFDPVTPLEETLRALDDCVSRGLVNTIGCSNLAAWQIMKALGISDKRGDNDSRRTTFDVPPIDKERAYDVIDAMEPIAKAHGSSVARVALAWLLQRKGVMTVIIGAKTIEQLDDNLAAAELTLTPEEIAKLDQASALKPEYPGWMLARQAEGRVPAAKKA